MRKILVALMAVIMALTVSVKAFDYKDIVRIHIRANSNSQEDQDMKIQVRDKINQYLAPILEKPKSKEEAVEILEKELVKLKDIADSVSGQNCRVTLGEEYFPKKTYNNKTYPEGEYTALIIEIGTGQGRNWWCVAFPNMCYTTSEKKVEYKSFFVELLERIGIL